MEIRSDERVTRKVANFPGQGLQTQLLSFERLTEMIVQEVPVPEGEHPCLNNCEVGESYLSLFHVLAQKSEGVNIPDLADSDELRDNAKAFLETLDAVRPDSAKQYLANIIARLSKNRNPVLTIHLCKLAIDYQMESQAQQLFALYLMDNPEFLQSAGKQLSDFQSLHDISSEISALIRSPSKDWTTPKKMTCQACRLALHSQQREFMK